MTASDHDRDYFRRLGEWERENAEEDLRDHLALTMDERMAASWALTVRWRDWVTHHEPDDFADIFYAKARERGLYKHG